MLVSFFVLFCATSCAKGKGTLKTDIKDLKNKITVFEKTAEELNTSYETLGQSLPSSDDIVTNQLEPCVTGAVNEIATDYAQTQVTDLMEQSNGQVAQGDTRINDLAKESVLKARATYVQDADLQELERQICALEQQARDATRSTKVSNVKTDIAQWVAKENELLAQYKKLASDNFNALDSNKSSIVSTFITAGQRQEVADLKVSGEVYKIFSGDISKDINAVIQKVCDEYASITDEKRATLDDLKTQVSEQLAVDHQNMDALSDLITEEVEACKNTIEDLKQGIKEIGQAKTKEDVLAIVARYDNMYKDTIGDYGQIMTEAGNLKVDSGDTYIANLTKKILKNQIKDEYSDSIKQSIALVANEYKEKAQNSVNKDDISQKAMADLTSAIFSQVGNVEAALKAMSPTMTKEVKDLRKYRDNIAKRVEILKDFDDTQMVSLEAGEYTDEYMSTYDVSAFKLGKYEVTYNLWYDVYQWALNNGYTFEGFGNQGSDFDAEGIEPSVRGKYQPVTNVDPQDAVIWCNAYSAKTGLTPVYTIEGEPVMNAGFSASAVTVDMDATGYRLPTETELLYAGAYVPPEGKTLDGKSDYAWTWYNSDCGTHNVGTKKAVKTVYKTTDAQTGKVAKKNAGVTFYDLHGNAAELATTDVTSIDANPVNGSWDRIANSGKYPYSYYHGFMANIYVPNSQGLRVAQF